MLQEKNFYIMKINFDEQEYVLNLESGTNPKFKFDKIITKEMKFDQMETKYLEIILYHVPSTFDIYKENKIENILKKAKIYSSFKIDLLTVAVGPEYHNIILRPPSKKTERLGRIMYTITCKQISNISVKINSVKVQMNGLLQNNVALSVKYKDKNKQMSTMYSHEINPNLNQKEKITEYNYLLNDERNNPLVINIISSNNNIIYPTRNMNVNNITPQISNESHTQTQTQTNINPLNLIKKKKTELEPQLKVVSLNLSPDSVLDEKSRPYKGRRPPKAKYDIVNSLINDYRAKLFSRALSTEIDNDNVNNEILDMPKRISQAFGRTTYTFIFKKDLLSAANANKNVNNFGFDGLRKNSRFQTTNLKNGIENISRNSLNIKLLKK